MWPLSSGAPAKTSSARVQAVLHSRTIEVLDQRGIADRFLAKGQAAQVCRFANTTVLDISDFPTRHNYGLALRQNHVERILAEWVDALAVPIYRGREVTGCGQDDLGHPRRLNVTPWADRVQQISAEYGGAWELPAIGCRSQRSAD
jgi:2-polyprenyl-6-methoxyphenol hydroxylase-like FAD-dependent oxidoreductase